MHNIFVNLKTVYMQGCHSNSLFSIFFSPIPEAENTNIQLRMFALTPFTYFLTLSVFISSLSHHFTVSKLFKAKLELKEPPFIKYNLIAGGTLFSCSTDRVMQWKHQYDSGYLTILSEFFTINSSLSFMGFKQGFNIISIEPE